MVFFASFLAIDQAMVKIFQNAFFCWLSFFNTHLLIYILPPFEKKNIFFKKGPPFGIFRAKKSSHHFKMVVEKF